MKKIIFIFSLIYINLSASALVVLKGTSCAGKTSIFKEIVAQDSNWLTIDEDALYIEQATRMWEKLFPEEWAIIANAIEPYNIFHAIKRNQIFFNPKLTIEEKSIVIMAIKKIQDSLDNVNESQSQTMKEWREALKNFIINQLTDALSSNKNIIIDSWLLDRAYFEQLKHKYNVKFVLAYANLPTIINRMFKRNYNAQETKDLRSMRFFCQAFKSFTDLYTLQPHDMPFAIDSISLNSLISTLYVAENFMHTSMDYESSKPFSRREFSQKQFQDYKETLLNLFNNDSSRSINISPKDQYDLILYTEKQSPYDSALQIRKYA